MLPEVDYTEMAEYFYQTTRRNISKDTSIRSNRHESL